MRGRPKGEREYHNLIDREKILSVQKEKKVYRKTIKRLIGKLEKIDKSLKDIETEKYLQYMELLTGNKIRR